MTVRTWGLTRGEGICSKGAYFGEQIRHCWPLKPAGLKGRLPPTFRELNGA